MNQLQAMRVFIRVADLGSFSIAGKQLGMSNSAVTRNICMLEAHLNMRLLNRSTRDQSLTEAGHRYLKGCREVLGKLDEIESDLARTTRTSSGILRIATPSVFGGNSLIDLFRAYRGVNPRVDYVVTVYDTAINLIDGGFDLCFASSRYPAPASLISRTLTSVQEVVVASPAYLARHGTPHVPTDLAKHELIALADGARVWEFDIGDALRRINVNGSFSASSYSTMRVATQSGMGIALLPQPLVEEDIANGTLLPLLTQHKINGGQHEISIVYPSRNYLTTRVRSFIDFTVDYFRDLQTDNLPELHEIA